MLHIRGTHVDLTLSVAPTKGSIAPYIGGAYGNSD